MTDDNDIQWPEHASLPGEHLQPHHDGGVLDIGVDLDKAEYEADLLAWWRSQQ